MSLVGLERTLGRADVDALAEVLGVRRAVRLSEPSSEHVGGDDPGPVVDRLA